MLPKIIDLLVPFGPYLRKTDGQQFPANWQPILFHALPLTFFIHWLFSFIPYGGLLYFLIAVPISASLHPTTTKLSRYSLTLWYMVVIAFGVGSLRGFIGHFFMSDFVASQIGWQTGSPFQSELAFMHLGVAIASFGAIWKRANLTEGIAVLRSTFLLGAAYVHLSDAIINHNFSPLNVGAILAGDILMPILVFYLLFQKSLIGK